MKSWAIAVSCYLVISLSAFAAEAALLHEQYHLEGHKSEKEWFSELYRQQEAENIFALASAKFRSIPQAKIIPLTLDEGGGDPLRLFSTVQTANPEQFHRVWIELLFGARYWNLEDENSFRSISVHSTSAIPLPGAILLFLSGLGILLLMRLRNRAKS